MSRIFTDEDGNEYEIATQSLVSPYITIMPVAKEDKLHCYIKFSHEDQQNGREFYYKDIDFTEPQATAVAASIEALMEYVTSSKLILASEVTALIAIAREVYHESS